MPTTSNQDGATTLACSRDRFGGTVDRVRYLLARNYLDRSHLWDEYRSVDM